MVLPIKIPTKTTDAQHNALTRRAPVLYIATTAMGSSGVTFNVVVVAVVIRCPVDVLLLLEG